MSATLQCQLCKKSKPKNAYSNSQLKKSKGQRRCKKCVKSQQRNVTNNAGKKKSNKQQLKSNATDKAEQPSNTLLQKLHDHCIGKSVFTEIHLAIKVDKNQDAIQKSLENVFKDIEDTFIYLDRIIIASNDLSYQRQIYQAIIDNAPLQFNDQETRYLLNQLIYPNGILSSVGVTFCDQNKTIYNTHISVLFETLSGVSIIKPDLDELSVYGYWREMMTNNIKSDDSILDAILVCLSYYQTMEEFSMSASLIKIVNKMKIEKIKPDEWCCAFGTVPIDSNTKNHYQWTLYIDKMHRDFSIGITSKREINELFVNKDYPNYAYSANGLVNNCNEAPSEHKGKTLRFSEGDTILMDLDFAKKQLKFIINGEYEGCLIEDIICGPIYYLGICMAVLYDSLSIKRFTWFNNSQY